MRNILLIIFILSVSVTTASEEWVKLHTDSGKSLHRSRIEMLNDNDFSICGNRGLITSKVLSTNDGGKNFDVLFLDTIKQVANNEIRMFSFHHEHKDHYLIMCSRLKYRYSSDAGKTWTYDTLRANSKAEIEATSFENYVFLNYDSVAYTSEDYGKTWESFKYNINHNYDLEREGTRLVLQKFSYLDKDLILGELDYFIDFYHEDNEYATVKSTDNGKSWQIILEKSNRNRFKYTLGQNGRIIGVGGRQVEPFKSQRYDVIKYSDNGGYNWTTVLDTVTDYYPVGIRDVRMNGKYGVAYLRGSYKMWRTTDNGETWNLDRSVEELNPTPDDYNVYSNGDIVTSLATGEIYKWSDPTLSAGSELVANPKSILLYPNPTNPSDGVNVEFTAYHSGLVEIALIDITGKRVSSIQRQAISGTELKYRFTPKEKLASGVYFIQIGYQNGEAYREKLVVE